MRSHFALAAIFVALAACTTGPQPRDYTVFREASPRSILVLPALNNTVSVDASDIFLSTVSRPFAERGYYVFPAHMVKSLLEQDGLSDVGLIYSADAARMGRLFNCDAALYITIERWESQYVVFSTSTNVAFNYELKSCKNGQELWSSKQALSYSPQQNNSSGNFLADMIAQAIVSAIEKAAPNYMPLAQQSNLLASSTVGQGLPAGPYLADKYNRDQEQFPAQSAPSQPTGPVTAPGVVQTTASPG
jgi:hypothetical protein